MGTIVDRSSYTHAIHSVDQTGSNPYHPPTHPSSQVMNNTTPPFSHLPSQLQKGDNADRDQNMMTWWGYCIRIAHTRNQEYPSKDRSDGFEETDNR